MHRYRAIQVTILLTAMALLPAKAGVIHKWVDQQGVTHYSDEPPTTATIPATKIEIPDADPTALGNDYYSIANQWRRLSQERLELERLKLGQAGINATQPAPQPIVVIIEDDTNDGNRVVFQRRHHRLKTKPATQKNTASIPRNWLAQRQRGGFYAPRHKRVFY